MELSLEDLIAVNDDLKALLSDGKNAQRTRKSRSVTSRRRKLSTVYPGFALDSLKSESRDRVQAVLKAVRLLIKMKRQEKRLADYPGKACLDRGPRRPERSRLRRRAP